MGIFQRGKFFGRWEFSNGANVLVDGNFPKGQFFWWMGIFQRGKFFGRWEFSNGANFLVDGNFPMGQIFW